MSESMESTLNVSKTFDDFMCGICLDILNNPHQCKNGHVFCLSCVSMALKRKKACPTCGVKLNEEQLSVNLILKNMIHESPIVKKCHHGVCEWSGPFKDFHQHEKECEETDTNCLFHIFGGCLVAGCTGKVKRVDLSSHHDYNLQLWRARNKMIDIQDEFGIWHEGTVTKVFKHGIRVHYYACSYSTDEEMCQEELYSRCKPLHTVTFNRLKWKTGDYVDVRVNEKDEPEVFVVAKIIQIDFVSQFMQLSYSEFEKEKAIRSTLPHYHITKFLVSRQQSASKVLNTLTREHNKYREVERYCIDVFPLYSHVKKPDELDNNEIPPPEMDNNNVVLNQANCTLSRKVLFNNWFSVR